MTMRTRHFVAGAGLAATLHVAAALVFFWSEPPRSTAAGAGAHGLQVGLGPPPGAYGQAAEIPPETASTVAPPEAAAAVAAPIEAAPVEAVEPVAIERAETVAAAAPTQPAARPPKAPVATPEPPKRSAETPPRKTAAKPPKETAATAPKKTVAKERTKKPPAKRPPKQIRERPSDALAAPSAPGVSGANASGRALAGSAQSAAGGGAPGARRDFMATLAAWLQKHKRYPRRARARRQEGVGRLHLKMAADGRVLSARLKSSSGHRILDDEILAMIRRAEPLPKIPAELGVSTFEVVVPVRFALR
ncbi:MAG: TonB family protein [Pseudomonadota bacterium]